MRRLFSGILQQRTIFASVVNWSQFNYTFDWQVYHGLMDKFITVYLFSRFAKVKPKQILSAVC